MNVFSLLIPDGLIQLIRDAFSSYHGKNEKRQHIERFLMTTVKENCMLGQDWVPTPSLLLDTEAAFVPLRLIGDNGRAEDLLSVISTHDRLVLQGQPGAGKSTITRFVALIMARAALDARQFRQLPQDLLGLAPLFPLRVELSDCGAGQSVEQRILSSVPEISAADMEKKIRQVPVLFLFDGLDEIASMKRRNEVMEEIRQLTFRYAGHEKGHRFLITTRSSSYIHQTLAGAGYALYRVDELAVDQQDVMVRRYYQLWSVKNQIGQVPGKWQERANDLVDQLRKNVGLARLRSNPLLLSQICYLHFTGATLPARRHEVYSTIIKHLVERRDYPTPSQIMRRLSHLDEIAIAMYLQEDMESMTRGQIEEILAETRPTSTSSESSLHSVPEITVDQIDKEWGILVQRSTGTDSAAHYAFANMSFQEYLAAHAVHGNPEKYWPILQDHLLEDRWEEVMFLYSAMPAVGKHGDPMEVVVEALMALDNGESLNVLLKAGRCIANDRTPPLHWHEEIVQRLRDRSYGDEDDSVKVIEVLCQIEPEGPSSILDRVLGRDGPLDQERIMHLLRRIGDSVARQHLREIFMNELDERPKLESRIRLAEALAQVGDTRLGAFIDLPQPKGKRSPTAFRIGKYPVTNVEYSLFLQSTSNSKPSHWQADGYPILKANHPVTHVNLADAHAYCDWLTRKTGSVCRLPSVEEWLMAARSSGSEQLFPWGSHMKIYNLNFRSQFNDTTPVGIYSEGENAFGVADLLGNVWEWTGGFKDKMSVLKGGAWNTMHELQDEGVLLERFESAETRSEDIGFRVVIE